MVADSVNIFILSSWLHPIWYICIGSHVSYFLLLYEACFLDFSLQQRWSLRILLEREVIYVGILSSSIANLSMEYLLYLTFHQIFDIAYSLILTFQVVWIKIFALYLFVWSMHMVCYFSWSHSLHPKGGSSSVISISTKDMLMEELSSYGIL
jgi:hypothetical protein